MISFTYSSQNNQFNAICSQQNQFPLTSKLISEDKFYGNTATSVENDTSNRNNSPLTPATDEDNLNAQKEQEWRDELAKLEDDIMTLRQVLHYKIQQTNELKHKLGITPMKEFQQDLKNGLQNIKESET